MNQNLARQILEQYEIVDSFIDPPDNISDRDAEKIFKLQDWERDKLDALCMIALRQIVIDEARRTLIGKS